MPKFNTLLNECGIDPKDVQLVRHKDRGPTGITPYSLFTTSSAQFDEYQSIQGRKVFHRKIIASFVVSSAPTYETLFVGLYHVGESHPNECTIPSPVRGGTIEPGRVWLYTLTPQESLRGLILRLTVVWGEGYRSWVQRADKQNKDILEIRRQFAEPRFPGYPLLREHIENIPTLYAEWRSVLMATRGVYLLVCNKTGAQYVGSASGDQGFFGRWLAYAADGHGGNKLLRDRGHKDYTVSILETVGSSVGRNEILALEGLWKEKLGSRAQSLGDEFRLNAN
jgi:hypothetical protein